MLSSDWAQSAFCIICCYYSWICGTFSSNFCPEASPQANPLRQVQPSRLNGWRKQGTENWRLASCKQLGSDGAWYRPVISGSRLENGTFRVGHTCSSSPRYTPLSQWGQGVSTFPSTISSLPSLNFLDSFPWPLIHWSLVTPNPAK